MAIRRRRKRRWSTVGTVAFLELAAAATMAGVIAPELGFSAAERFNNRFGDTFPVPEALIPETTARVMSLTDPTTKMSKSDPNEKSRVLILDSPDVVRKKIKSAVTDSDPDVRFDTEAKPGVSNLLEIMSTCTDQSIDQLVDEYGSTGYGRFKEAVAEAVIAELAPIRSKYQQLEDEEVARVMRRGALDARTKAEGFQQIVREATGLAAI